MFVFFEIFPITCSALLLPLLSIFKDMLEAISGQKLTKSSLNISPLPLKIKTAPEVVSSNLKDEERNQKALNQDYMENEVHS